MAIPKPLFRTFCLFSVWTAIFHLAGQSFSPGAVLCLRDDGYLGVGLPGGVQPCPSPAHASPLPALSLRMALGDGCCGPCADLILPEATTSDRPTGRLFAADHGSFPVCRHPALANLPSTNPAILASCLSLSKSLPASHLYRATVLLI